MYLAGGHGPPAWVVEMRFLAHLEKLSKAIPLVMGFALIGIIGILDYRTGYEFSLFEFYVVPIALVTWLVSRPLGIATAMISATSWLLVDTAAHHPYSQFYMPLWNTLIRLAFFLVIVALVSALKRAAGREHELARTDYLTGAANSRSFFETVESELIRLRRYGHAFTLIYIDVDDFKRINDHFGHRAGDRILIALVETARAHLRDTDVVARIGGDEFALLLPETGESSAEATVVKIREVVLGEMQRRKWPVTLSMGALTCTSAPEKTAELLERADALMYAVKHAGKNAVRFGAYP